MFEAVVPGTLDDLARVRLMTAFRIGNINIGQTSSPRPSRR